MSTNTNLEIADIGRLEEPLDAGPNKAGWGYSFCENLSAEEYARRQGIQPTTNIALLYGAGNPEDWQGFDEVLESWRTEQGTI